MKDEDLRIRTRKFALAVIRLYSTLPGSAVAQVLGKQMVRSGTSVGAHYAEGHRSRSNAEVISKLEGALQEAEETRYWFALLLESEIVQHRAITPLDGEAEELIAILVTCVKRVKARIRRPEAK